MILDYQYNILFYHIIYFQFFAFFCNWYLFVQHSEYYLALLINFISKPTMSIAVSFSSHGLYRSRVVCASATCGTCVRGGSQKIHIVLLAFEIGLMNFARGINSSYTTQFHSCAAHFGVELRERQNGRERERLL